MRRESNLFRGWNVCRNNAGYMSGKFELSADGLEKVFATNQVGK